MTENGSKVMGAFYRSCLGKNPTFKDDKIAIAAALREAVQCILPDNLEHKEHTPSGKFVGWKYEMLQLADEIENISK